MREKKFKMFLKLFSVLYTLDWHARPLYQYFELKLILWRVKLNPCIECVVMIKCKLGLMTLFSVAV